MQKLIALFILTITFLVGVPRLQAQDTPNSTENDEITENLKKRLQESLETAKQNIITETIELGNRPKAFVGTVQDVIQETIEIETKDGIRYAKTDKETTILRSPANTEIDVEDIRIDDFIITMGYVENDTTLNGKRIIVSQSTATSLNKTSGKGTITDVTSNNITLTDGTVINLLSSTIVKSTQEILDLEDLSEGQEIIYTADLDDDELDATIIMVIRNVEPEILTNTEDSVE